MTDKREEGKIDISEMLDFETEIRHPDGGADDLILDVSYSPELAELEEQLETMNAINVAQRTAIEELVADSEPDSIEIAPASKHELLPYLVGVVRELRVNGYLSSSDELGGMLVSTQTVDDGPAVMEILRDAFDHHDRSGVGRPKEELAVDGLTVYESEHLPPGMVVAVATKALAETPPEVVKPFIVRDRRGVEVRRVDYLE